MVTDEGDAWDDIVARAAQGDPLARAEVLEDHLRWSLGVLLDYAKRYVTKPGEELTEEFEAACVAARFNWRAWPGPGSFGIPDAPGPSAGSDSGDRRE